MRAVGTLQEDPAYKGKFDAEIILMSTDKGKMSKLLYQWGGEGHGLVVLGPDGSERAKLLGHNWATLEPDTAIRVLKETLDPLLADDA